jgi:LPXTG-motif cell wall-anchored protein
MTNELSRPLKITSWILQVLAAVIFLQTLFFKFTGAPEAVYIFETLGIEPWGRWGTGIAELVAAGLLLVPRTVVIGAGLSVVMMVGAIFGHLTKLGIAIPNPDGNGDDGGTLFVMAIIVLIAGAAVLVIRRRQVPGLGGHAKLDPA